MSSCVRITPRRISTTSLNDSNSIILSSTDRIWAKTSSVRLTRPVRSVVGPPREAAANPGRSLVAKPKRGSAICPMRRASSSGVSSRLLSSSKRIIPKASAISPVSPAARDAASLSLPVSVLTSALASSRSRACVRSAIELSKRLRSRISRASSIVVNASTVTTSSDQMSLEPRFGRPSSVHSSTAVTPTVRVHGGTNPSGSSNTSSGDTTGRSINAAPACMRAIGRMVSLAAGCVPS